MPSYIRCMLCVYALSCLGLIAPGIKIKTFWQTWYNLFFLFKLPTGLRMQASWQPWSAADASACTLRKVGGRTEDIYICACICTASASPNLARTFLRYMCSETKQNWLFCLIFLAKSLYSFLFGQGISRYKLTFKYKPFLRVRKDYY